MIWNFGQNPNEKNDWPNQVVKVTGHHLRAVADAINNHSVAAIAVKQCASAPQA